MKEEPRYEELIERLEAIVEQLERGEKPLDESLELFQEGVSLVKTATKRLDGVEKKVEILMKDIGKDERFEEFPDAEES